MQEFTIEMMKKIKFISVSTAGEMFNKGQRYVLKRIHRGELPFIRIGSEFRIAVWRDEFEEYQKLKGENNDSTDDS